MFMFGSECLYVCECCCCCCAYADSGVVGGCSELCGILQQKTGSKVAGEVCDLLCVVVGIKEFIDLIQK